ncbi:hypothetical protein [Arthrobacter sp. NPDC057013]|uniref:hypothetical protein n=1 Tax=Arthrobacter sp. NPDC057013 TaxID=3345999 RepID=UPI003641776C
MGDEQGSNEYEWQSWPPDSLEGMPPKRRRLVGWGLLWFLFMSWLVATVLEAAGIPEPWSSLLTAIAVVAVFGPLIRGAVQETRQLRAEGIDLPSYPVTRKSLIGNAVIVGVVWTAFGFLVASGRTAIPLLPIAGTIWLLYQLHRWKTRLTDNSPGQ